MHFHQWKRREFITLLGGAMPLPPPTFGVIHRKAVIDTDIAAFRPSALFQPVPKRCEGFFVPRSLTDSSQSDILRRPLL